MEEPYQIRPAQSQDVEQLTRVERECFADPWSPAGIQEVVQSETTVSLLAHQGTLVLGYLMARTSGEEGEILNLAVIPAHRRRGIGRSLLARGLAALASRGVREVYLEVRQSNADAIGLYRSLGFRPVGLRPRYYRSPAEDALVLRAPLLASRN